MEHDPRFPNLRILDHPLIQHKLAHLRDQRTGTQAFRALLREIAWLMGYEVTRDLPLTPHPIETPMAPMTARVIAGRKLAIVPVLRAGLGMSDGLLELMPGARVGHIGLHRDAQHRPIEYWVSLPNPEARRFILCDPMVATGHSAAHAIATLRQRGVPEADIRFLALVAAPEGVQKLLSAHPGVKLFAAALDSHLNERGYIIPGLGDAGDRLFGARH